MPSAPRPLNIRQARFVDAYTSGPTLGNATASARAAGYTGSEAVLSSTGCDLLRVPKVAVELAKRAAKDSRPKIADAAEVREAMTHDMRTGTPSERAKAAAILAKMGGWFSFVHRHEGSEGGAIVHEVKVTLEDAKAIAREKP